MLITVKCTQCNSSKLIWPYQLKLHILFFCNRSCSAKYYVHQRLHTPEVRIKSGLSRRGQKRTPEQKLKISLAKKGHIPWNKGKHPEYMQGKSHPMYGTHPIAWNKGLTKETDERVASYAKSQKGIKRPWQVGKKHPNWGNKLNIQAWNKGKKFPEYSGKHHFAWKGEKVGYSALHDWVRKYLGKPDTCEHCSKSSLKGRQIHWANKSQKYKRV